MIARDAGRAAAPPPPPPPPSGPSFLRRHPLLAGFGVLAALSLFAAYWPASAIVTGVVVAARASGADQVALGVVREGARRLLDRVRNGPRPDRATDGPTPEPVAASPDPSPVAGPPSPTTAPSPAAADPAPAPPESARPSPRPSPRRSRPAVRRGKAPAPEVGMEVER